MSDTMKRMWTERQVRALGVDGTEQKSALKVFEHIADNDGHLRFIEGVIEPKTITGFTFTYARWSLSGSHLLIVLGGTIESGTAFSYGTIATLKDVPAWIKDKLVPIYGSSGIDVVTLPVYASDYSSQNVTSYLTKSGSNINIDLGSNTFSANRTFRIEFDLLIDNE